MYEYPKPICTRYEELPPKYRGIYRKHEKVVRVTEDHWPFQEGDIVTVMGADDNVYLTGHGPGLEHPFLMCLSKNSCCPIESFINIFEAY